MTENNQQETPEQDNPKTPRPHRTIRFWPGLGVACGLGALLVVPFVFCLHIFFANLLSLRGGAFLFAVPSSLLVRSFLWLAPIALCLVALYIFLAHKITLDLKDLGLDENSERISRRLGITILSLCMLVPLLIGVVLLSISSYS
ncbi:MAG: hypothetical protein LBU07_03360 [Coriobacteriales bacterium]|jgi:hypothetical protein|nr:hypothetical protein [Coriobacteriales bacterium]